MMPFLPRVFDFTRMGCHSILLSSVLVATSCTSPSVRTDFDATFDFAAVRSFEWDLGGEEAASSAPHLSVLDLQRFESAVQALVVARGYAPNPPGDVVLRAGLTSEAEYRSFVTNVGVGRYGYGYSYGHRYSPVYLGRSRFGFGPSVTVTQRTRATFYLDVFDSTDNELVWSGSASVPLSWVDLQDPAERQRRIDRVAAALLEEFPR